MADGNDRRVGFEEFTGLSFGRALLMAVPVLALVAGTIWVAVQFLDPMPPRRIVLATGPEGSVLHALGTRYAERMAAQGIAVDVRATRGAADNVALLGDRKERVDAAFLPAGTADPKQAGGIVNVSNLFHAPLWCLSRDPSGEVTLSKLRGRRIAIGAPGTGLNFLLRPLLAANGITPGNTTLLEISPQESVQALAAEAADVIFLGEGLRGPQLAQALELPGVRVMDFTRAAAYERRFAHAVRLQLPKGTVDLARDIPDRDLTMIGTTVMMAARADVHPTVVDLLVDTARQLHSGQGVFEKRGEFPNLHAVDDVPVSDQAALYTREGPSFLRRYLPLWAADAIQRAIVLAVPLLAVLIPLGRWLPAILDVIGRRHLLLGYARLRRVEGTLRARDAGVPADDLLRQLDRIEESVTGVKESVIKAGELYTFRVHVRVVRESVLARLRASQAPSAAARPATARAGEAR
ncbi:MAG TPA: TAXI family TRAP transporter solute-binding subunit [Burkholderiaceae bacterium]|nr:TAXI family TRAP transporter solute-binding subunit [Burkholderiaceae bacterium]